MNRVASEALTCYQVLSALVRRRNVCLHLVTLGSVIQQFKWRSSKLIANLTGLNSCYSRWSSSCNLRSNHYCGPYQKIESIWFTRTGRRFIANEYKHSTPEEFPQSSPYSSSPMLLRNMPVFHYGTTETMSRRKSFTQTQKSPVVARSYIIAELCKVKNSFSDECLLGKGSLSSVFKAEFPDGH